MSEKKQDNRGDFLLDMSKIAGSLLGSLSEMKNDMEQAFRNKMAEYCTMDYHGDKNSVAKHSDTIALKKMVEQLSKENDMLKKRISQLEGKPAVESVKKMATKKPTALKKTPVKKAAVKEEKLP